MAQAIAKALPTMRARLAELVKTIACAQFDHAEPQHQQCKLLFR